MKGKVQNYFAYKSIHIILVSKDRVNKILKNALVSVNNAEQQIGLLAGSSEEQSTTAEQVSKGIEDTCNFVHRLAIGAQQIVKHSKILINLKNLIGQFKTKSNNYIYSSTLEM